MKIILVFLSVLISSYLFAQPSLESRIGLGYSWQMQFYKGGKTRLPIIPLIQYQYKNLSLRGPFLSYKIYNKWPQVSLLIAPEFLNLKPGIDDITNGLQERKITVNAGISIFTPFKHFTSQLSFIHDILHRYNGHQIRLSLSKRFILNPHITMISSLNLNYVSSHYSQYYFGVSKDEANAFRKIYNPGHAFIPGIGLTTNFELNNKWSLILINRFEILPNNLFQSPLVDRPFIFQNMLGVQYKI